MPCKRGKDCILRTKSVKWDYRTRVIDHGLQQLYRPKRSCRMWCKSSDSKSTEGLRPHKPPHQLPGSISTNNTSKTPNWLTALKPVVVEWMLNNYSCLPRASQCQPIKQLKNFTASQLFISYLTDVPPICLGCLPRNKIVEYIDYLMAEHCKIRHPKSPASHCSLGLHKTFLSDRNENELLPLSFTKLKERKSRLQHLRGPSLEDVYSRFSCISHDSHLSKAVDRSQTPHALNRLLSVLRNANGETLNKEKTVKVGQAAEEMAKLVYETVQSRQDTFSGRHALASAVPKRYSLASRPTALADDSQLLCHSLFSKDQRGKYNVTRHLKHRIAPSTQQTNILGYHDNQHPPRQHDMRTRFDKLALLALVYRLPKKKSELRQYFQSVTPSSQMHVQILPSSQVGSKRTPASRIVALRDAYGSCDVKTSDSHNLCRRARRTLPSPSKTVIKHDILVDGFLGMNGICNTEHKKLKIIPKSSDVDSKRLHGCAYTSSSAPTASSDDDATPVLRNSNGALQMDVHIPIASHCYHDSASSIDSEISSTRNVSATSPYTPIWGLNDLVIEGVDDLYTPYSSSFEYDDIEDVANRAHPTPDVSSTIYENETSSAMNRPAISRLPWEASHRRKLEAMTSSRVCGIWRISTPATR